ncbi:MAG: TIGR04076 family protein [Candidatus Aminicenantes bacterium]|nr:TIGR04076 family protein [Candidatus Aminicenantes bacterium]
MEKRQKDLMVSVEKIEGVCPTFKIGQTFLIKDGYKLIADFPVCLHALQSISPYYVALSRGIQPQELGLAGPDEAAYVQCLDPYRITGGGTVTFKIKKKNQE